MQALDLDGQVVQKPALSTLAESPSGLSSETTSSGCEAASVTQSLAVAPRVNSLKRSPLGRSVVTALEAELDQVFSHQLYAASGQRLLTSLLADQDFFFIWRTFMRTAVLMLVKTMSTANLLQQPIAGSKHSKVARLLLQKLISVVNTTWWQVLVLLANISGEHVCLLAGG